MKYFPRISKKISLEVILLNVKIYLLFSNQNLAKVKFSKIR